MPGSRSISIPLLIGLKIVTRRVESIPYESQGLVAGAERSPAVLKHDNWPNAELALCVTRHISNLLSESKFDNADFPGRGDESSK